MAKLVFPTVGAPYRGFVGETRGWYRTIASYAEKSPGSIPALTSQLEVLAVYLSELQASTAPAPVDPETP